MAQVEDEELYRCAYSLLQFAHTGATLLATPGGLRRLPPRGSENASSIIERV